MVWLKGWGFVNIKLQNPFCLNIMKQSIPFIAILFVSVSCLKDDNTKNDPRFMPVEQYVTLLKSGEFNAWEIPIFEITDISKLLKHARDEYEISFSEINPVSSVPPERMRSTVGMMVLWAIEGTRLDVDKPSSVPPAVMDDKIYRAIQQSEVADLYERWWSINNGKNLVQLKEISPLEGTGYSWH